MRKVRKAVGTKITISTECEADTLEVLEAIESVMKHRKYKVKRKAVKAAGKRHIVTYIDIKSPLQKTEKTV